MNALIRGILKSVAPVSLLIATYLSLLSPTYTAEWQGEKRPYRASLVRVDYTSLEPKVVDLAVLASVIFVFGLVRIVPSSRRETTPLVFVAAGVILSPAGFGLVEFKLLDHIREAKNSRTGDPRGLCADQYSERWVRPNEISRWKEPGT